MSGFWSFARFSVTPALGIHRGRQRDLVRVVARRLDLDPLELDPCQSRALSTPFTVTRFNFCLWRLRALQAAFVGVAVAT
jgi:hypothetical protein